MTTPIIAFCNHKGGSGKTTSAYYIAALWSSMGINTLAIDLDSQGTLSRRMSGAGSRDAGDPTIADLLASTMHRGDLDADDCILSTGRCDLIPADHRLGWVAAKMQAHSPNHNILQRAIKPLTPHWDAIIMDCPPSADIIIVNALVAATHAVICATPTPESWDGQERMRAMIADIAESIGQAPAVLGLLATQTVERAHLHRMHMQKMDPDLIGSVPLRIGVDQDAQLLAAYRPLAEHLAVALELDREAVHA